MIRSEAIAIVAKRCRVDGEIARRMLGNAANDLCNEGSEIVPISAAVERAIEMYARDEKYENERDTSRRGPMLRRYH